MKLRNVLCLLVLAVFTACDDGGTTKPALCECEGDDKYLAYGDECDCALNDCDCAVKEYGAIDGVPVYRTAGIAHNAAEAAWSIIKDEVKAADIAGLDLNRIIIGSANSYEPAVITISSAATAAQIRAYLDDLIDPLCICEDKEHYLQCECDGRECECTVKAYGQLNVAVGVVSEQIPIFMTEGVTEEQMTAAVANIQAGFNGLNGMNQDALYGKIGEIRIIESAPGPVLPVLKDGKYVVTFLATMTPSQIATNFTNWINNGTIK
jgi:hypothetical protein